MALVLLAAVPPATRSDAGEIAAREIAFPSVAPSMPPVYRQWAERLGEAGFAVLRYDKRFLTHPGIDIAAFDEEAQIGDARSAVAFLRTAPGLASKPIFLIGHSEGGTLAPIVAERAGAIAGVVVVNAAGNREARLRELSDHDHLGMRPGEREPSSEFMLVVVGWLGTARARR